MEKLHEDPDEGLCVCLPEYQPCKHTKPVFLWGRTVEAWEGRQKAQLRGQTLHRAKFLHLWIPSI